MCACVCVCVRASERESLCYLDCRGLLAKGVVRVHLPLGDFHREQGHEGTVSHGGPLSFGRRDFLKAPPISQPNARLVWCAVRACVCANAVAANTVAALNRQADLSIQRLDN